MPQPIAHSRSGVLAATPKVLPLSIPAVARQSAVVDVGSKNAYERPLAGGLSDRIGARWVAFTGFAIVGIATVPFALAAATTSEWYLVGVLVVRGFGLAAVMIPLSAAAFIGLRHDEIPHGSMITRVAQQVGGSFGVAVLAVILDSALRNQHSGSAAAAQAFDQAFWWAVGFAGLALVLSLLLPGHTPEQATDNG
jgi:MFS family permease